MDINEEINALIAEMDEISHRKSSTKVEKCNNYVRYNDVRNLILIKVLEAYLAGYRLIAPTLTPPNEWVSVEERLPEDEARQYIEDVLDGIGYLYPCLLTYKSGVQDKLLAALHIMSDGLYGIVDANFDRLMRDHGYDAPDESGEDKDVF